MMLQVENMSVHYDQSRALADVTIRVPEGAIVGVIGPNGAGKTTLLRSVAGLIWPTEGRIVFRGQDVTRMPIYARARRGIMFLPETRELFWGMTVEKNLLLGANASWHYPTVKEDLRRVLEYFPRLHERLRQRVNSMSGGEQQMLAIARTLMGRPRLLLLDEPSLGLAPTLVREIFDIVYRLRVDLGMTILVAEQNTNMVFRIADMIYGLNLGSIAFEGTADTLRHEDEIRKLFLT